MSQVKEVLDFVANVSSSSLPSAKELQETAPSAVFVKNPFRKELEQTCALISSRGKGILAADESLTNIGKRFASINVENNENNRQRYRELLFSTPGISEYISGAIMNSETIKHKSDDGVPFPQLLSKAGVIPGIKLDMVCSCFFFLFLHLFARIRYVHDNNHTITHLHTHMHMRTQGNQSIARQTRRVVDTRTDRPGSACC